MLHEQIQAAMPHRMFGTGQAPSWIVLWSLTSSEATRAALNDLLVRARLQSAVNSSKPRVT
jgi:hypothetical protein